MTPEQQPTNDIYFYDVYYDIMRAIELTKSKSQESITNLKNLMIKYNLHVKDGKIKPKVADEYNNYVVFWNQRQQAKKILLNSLYGALLNESMKFYDKRIGQSVTLTGRYITKHMSSYTNECITGKYEIGDAVIYSDTDSVVKDTNINYKTVHGNEYSDTIAELFDKCSLKWEVGNKEYAADPRFLVDAYNPDTNNTYNSTFNYIYRHKTDKQLWEIVDAEGNVIIVTEDHACVVERNNELITIFPYEIQPDDVIISLE